MKNFTKKSNLKYKKKTFLFWVGGEGVGWGEVSGCGGGGLR